MADDVDEFAALIPKGAAPAAEAPTDEFSALIPKGERMLTREQEIRRERLMALLQANPDGTPMRPGGKLAEPGYIDRIKDNATSGVMRPIGGAMAVGSGLLDEMRGGKPATIGERWRAGVGAEDDYIKRAEANTEGPLGVAADLAGGLIGGGTQRKALKWGAQMLQSGVQGAIEGASRNAKDFGSAAGGALTSAGVNMGLTGVAGALLDRFKRVTNAKTDIGTASRGGNSQTLDIEGGNIFQRLDNAGIHYKPSETAPLAQNVVQRLNAAGFNPNMHHELIPAIAEMGAASGQRTTWSQLRNMQTQISDLKASDNPRLRRVAGELADELDNFIHTAKPTMPASSVRAGVNPATEIDEARRLWATGSKAKEAEALAEVGTRRASDPTSKVAENFETYTDSFKKDPSKYNPFGNNSDQMRLMDKIVGGSPKMSAASKAMDWTAKGLAGAGGVGLAGGLLGPALGFDTANSDKATNTSAGVLALAAALRGGSTTMKKIIAEKGAAQVNDLLRNIVTGSTDATNAYVPRQALAKVMAAQQGARGVGNYFGNKPQLPEEEPPP